MGSQTPTTQTMEADVPKTEPEHMTSEELEAKLAKAKSLQGTVIGVFIFIVLAWLVLGLWRKKIPVFISTVVMSVAATAVVTSARNRLEHERRRRRQSP